MNKETSFIDNIRGKDQLIGFKIRWSSELGTRKPEILSKPRAETLTKCFEMIEKVYQKYGLLTSDSANERVFNTDESGFSHI